jgi:hypothetical protein
VVLENAAVALPAPAAPSPEDLLARLLVQNVIPGGCSNLIARTEIVRDVGAFDERLSQLADRDLWIRLAEVTPGVACPYVVVAYRTHGGNMSRRRGLDGVAEYEYMREKYRAALLRNGVDASRKPGYRYFARKQLQARRRFAAAVIFAELAFKELSPTDLVRAFASIVLGEGVTDTVRRVKPPVRPSLPEIEVLQSRTPEEIAWLRELTHDDVEWLAPMSNGMHRGRDDERLTPGSVRAR